MAYETKVMLALIADRIYLAKDVREAYEAVRSAANVEGLELPSFDDRAKKEDDNQGALK